MRYVASIVVACFLCGCRPAVTESDRSLIAEHTSDELYGIDSTIEAKPDELNQEHPDMKELFLHFLESPDRDSYLAVRNALISSEHYDPYSDEMDKINELLDAGKLEEAREKLSESMPNLLLSPSAHLTISFIAEKSDDEKGAKMEGFIAATCCEGVLATGDGTKDNPYIVVRTSDEHDVVQYLGKQFTRQSLIEDGNRYFDRINCDDGSELWFDVTDPYNKLGEAFGEGSP